MSHALIPGSFDPMTLGHLNIVKRALEEYDRVTVAVMINDAKVYAHSIEERTEMARLTVAGFSRVQVVADRGMLVDLFDRIGATAIVKGVRNEADRAYEQTMAQYNLSRNPRAVTVLYEADPAFGDLSSTAVREMLERGERPEGLLASAVLDYLAARGECPSIKEKT
jgi:pantetheine-phosphate adenylyltransferase